MNREVYGQIAFAGFIFMMGMIFAITLWGFNHDYIIYNANNVSRTLEGLDLISSDIADNAETVANSHGDWVSIFDWGWVLAYVIFFGASIATSYASRDEDEFSFLTMTLYGIILLLFIVSIIDVLTNYFANNVLYNLIPNLEGNLPRFEFYLSNIGIFSFVHLLICIFANKINLNIKSRKGGVDVVDKDEIL